MRASQPFARVYAIYPCLGGFAFALIETRGRLVDWGKVDLGQLSDNAFSARMEVELARFAPLTLALEAGGTTKRSVAAQRRIRCAIEVANRLGIQSVAESGESVRAALGLSAAATKHQVAGELCRRFPELTHRMPKYSVWRRDPWMHVFVAVGLAWSAIQAESRRDA